MSRDDVDIKPPRSLADHSEYRSRESHSRGASRVQSPAAKSRQSNGHNDRGGSHADFEDHGDGGGNDFDSTAQERSENGDEEILHIVRSLAT